MISRQLLTAPLLALLLLAPGTSHCEEAEPTPTPAATPEAPADEAIRILQSESLPAETKRELLQGLVNAHPNVGEAWAAYGEVLNTLGETPTALMAFRKATDVNPSLHSPWMWIGILLKRGTPEPDLPQAEQAFRRALAEGGSRSQGLNELGVTLAMQGKMDEAISAWEAAIAADPDWGVLYSNLFKAARSKGDAKLIEKHFDAALRAARFEPSAVMMYGEMLSDQKRHDRAADVYARALEVRPADARVRYYRAVALANAGKKNDARAEFDLAQRQASEDPEGRANDIIQMIHFERFRMDHPSDESRFQDARKLVFDNDPRKAPDAVRKDLERALRIMDPLMEKHPEFWNGYFVRGVAHRRLDQREAARADLERVIELQPGEPNATMQLALMERDEYNFQRAAELAEQALVLAPRDPLFAINAGLIMIEAGNCDRAWELYGRAIRMIGEANAAVLKEELDVRCARAQ